MRRRTFMAIIFLLLSLPCSGETIEEVMASAEYKNLSVPQWDAKIQARSISTLFADRVKELAAYYQAKIARVKSLRDETTDLRLQAKLDVKLLRLRDKWACVVKEAELRQQGLVTRIPHHTIYYCDYIHGSDANDGLTIKTPWQTISKYTSVTVRTPGDILYVRANQTHTVTADINFDEDGTAAAYIYIIGCDAATHDPWSDVSNVLPIVDFGDAAYQLLMLSDDYWNIKRLDVRASADTNGAMYESGKRVDVDIKANPS